MKHAKLIIICLTLLGSQAVWGQTRQAFLDAAESAFQAKDYYSSMTYYMNVLEFREDIGVLYKAAESARLFNSFEKAEEFYKKVADLQQNGEHPLTTFWLAEVQKLQGKYTDAKGNYELYLSENELDNPYYTNTARKQVQDCEWAVAQADSARADVTIERLGEHINTRYSEYGPVYHGDTLYYSSLRFPSELDESVPERIYSNALWSVSDAEGTQIDPEFNDKELHTGHVVFSHAKDRVYYTICEYITPSEIRCDLYYRDIENDTFGDPVKLPGNINDSTHTSTQPAVGLDPETKQEALYFASDRPGSKGKLDLWYSVIGDNFGDPVNLMSINTMEDDITPFYHHKSETLYFSSTGYQGYGGFDIYGVYMKHIDDPYVENLGAPINSSYNDIYYFLGEAEETGYLSSNREGSLYLEEGMKSCCNDIYKATFDKVEISLKAITYDQATRADLLGSTVTLLEVNGEEILVDRKTADNTNEFNFPLLRNRSYKVIAEKPGYFPDTIMLSTRGINESREITRRLYLRSQSLDLELLVFDDSTREAIRGATVKLLDLSDPSSETVVQINEDDNSFIFPLQRDKSYQIITSRRGYVPDTMQLSTSNVPDDRMTRRVYLKRGGPTHYVPLAVYFDNDHPNPKTYYRRTRVTYDDTYPPYMARKEAFKENFGAPLLDNARVKADDDIERFFEYDVREGRNDIIMFIGALTDALDKGQKIEVVIQGFASPRAGSSYNDLLSSRRISSVLNQFRRFSDGALIKYLNRGELKIIQEPLGETTSPIYVSDEISDERNSIYGVPASRERRVEIIDVRIVKDDE